MPDYHPHASSFGDLLRRARLAANLTQEELAEKAGVSVRGISDLERGSRRAPQRATVDLLAYALDLTDAEKSAWERSRRQASKRGDRPRPARASLHSSPGSQLPHPLTELVGREHDVRAIVTLLQDQATRLITLVGAGGIGKTRLGIAVAHAVAHDFPDKAYFVSLAATRDPNLIVAVIARELGLRLTGNRSALDVLREFLQRRRMLLVLDNLEHLTDAAPQIVDLLEYAPGVTILATSRARLRVRSEREYLVPPLSLPPADCSSLDALMESASAQLFLQRARDIAQQKVLTSENVPSIVQICRHLDGLPLAIELATARLRLVSPETLAQLLEQRLPLLTGGPSDLPARQRTLGDTIRWSYDLLTPGQQQLLRYLSVCAGGWTIDVAAAIAQADMLNLLADLTALSEQSLIRQVSTSSGDQRLGMLETIREFGTEALKDHQELHSIQQRHAAFFKHVALRQGAAVLGDAVGAMLDELDNEFDNMRVAFTWLVAEGRAQDALEMASALQWYWIRRAPLTEAERWLDQALALEHPVPPGVQAAALNTAGFVAGYRNDPCRAQHLHQQALDLFEAIGDRRGTGHALHGLGTAAELTRDYASATRYYTASGAMFRQTDDWIGTCAALSKLANLLEKTSGGAQVPELHHEALSIAKAQGDAAFQSICLNHLTRLALRDGEVQSARALVKESLALNRTIRTGRHSVTGLELAALLRMRQGQRDLAAVLLGSATSQRERLGIQVSGQGEQPDWFAQQLMAAREDLQKADLLDAWSTGRQLSLTDAIELALADDISVETGASLAIKPRYPAGLSAREVEVLRLVSRGMTDAEVAEQLFLSPRTVSQHLRSVYNKLGVNSRTAATRFAVEHELG